MREVLYDVEWQRLRMSCLSVHHSLRGWASLEGTRDNLQRLHEYVLSATECTDTRELHVRCYRVNNALAATAMGYSGQGKWETEARVLVQAARVEHYDVYNKVGVQSAAFAWNWKKVEKDLIEFWQSDPVMFDALHKNLTKRSRNKQHANSRPELDKFLMLMRYARRK